MALWVQWQAACVLQMLGTGRWGVGGQWTGHDTCFIQLNNACRVLSCMFNWLPRAWYRQDREIVNLFEFGFMCMPPKLPTMPAAHHGRVQWATKHLCVQLVVSRNHHRWQQSCQLLVTAINPRRLPRSERRLPWRKLVVITPTVRHTRR